MSQEKLYQVDQNGEKISSGQWIEWDDDWGLARHGPVVATGGVITARAVDGSLVALDPATVSVREKPEPFVSSANILYTDIEGVLAYGEWDYYIIDDREGKVVLGLKSILSKESRSQLDQLVGRRVSALVEVQALITPVE